MPGTIALTGEETAQVQAILAAHLPHDVRVAVFGSRAGGRPKPWSDLDLVLVGNMPIALADMAALAEAFDESSLGFKVDLVDRAMISASFAAIVDATMIDLA